MGPRNRAARLFAVPLVVPMMLLVSACVPRPLPPEPPPWRNGAYDFRTVSRIGGEILSIDDIRSRDPAFSGIVVVLRAEKGSISVHLGPQEFFDRSEVSFQPGDRLDVEGLSTKYDDAPVLWATKVKKENRQFDVSDRTRPSTGGEVTKP